MTIHTGIFKRSRSSLTEHKYSYSLRYFHATTEAVEPRLARTDLISSGAAYNTRIQFRTILRDCVLRLDDRGFTLMGSLMQSGESILKHHISGGGRARAMSHQTNDPFGEDCQRIANGMLGDARTNVTTPIGGWFSPGHVWLYGRPVIRTRSRCPRCIMIHGWLASDPAQ